MKRFFDFSCENGHKHEMLVENTITEVICVNCGQPAKKIPSATRSFLEPFTGAFPGAYDKWERVRAEKLKQERKQNSES